MNSCFYYCAAGAPFLVWIGIGKNVVSVRKSIMSRFIKIFTQLVDGINYDYSNITFT